MSAPRPPRVHLPEHTGVHVEAVAQHLEVHMVGRSQGPALPHHTGVDLGQPVQAALARLDQDDRRSLRRGTPAPRSARAPAHRTAPASTASTPVGGDGAHPYRLELVAAVAAQSHRPVAVHGERHPGAPPEPPGRPSTSSTSTRRSMPPTRDSCSATRSSLSRRCAAGETCWKSQPPHRPGPAWGQSGVDTVRRRLQDLDGVGPQERRRLRGDAGPHPLAGQAVAHEHDPTVRRPGHAAPTGGDGTGLELHDLVQGGGRRGHASVLSTREARPRRAVRGTRPPAVR